MFRFSASLGFLWTDRTLPEAIRAAKRAGFDAVECHWPYDTPAEEIKSALQETGLTMVGLNTARGDVEDRENGLSALPGRSRDALKAIDQALEYAVATNTANVHVMAGVADGAEAHSAFVAALRYATARAAVHGIGILIEPLNHYDAPGYFLKTAAQAVEIIDEVAEPNLRLMFDCYHVQLMEGDLTNRIVNLSSKIGHVQIASVPDRAEPDHGEVDYRHIFEVLEGISYPGAIGAEYKPRQSTEHTPDWLRRVRSLERACT